MKVTDGFKKGYYIWSSKPINNTYVYPLQGQTIARDSNRIEFIDYIDSKYRELENMLCPDPPSRTREEKARILAQQTDFVDTTTYNKIMEAYQTCGKFIYNYNNKSLKLPTTLDIIDKSIETYDVQELEYCIENYTCCYCYPGLTVCTTYVYKNGPFNIIREVETKDVWQDTIPGYIYLIIKDLNIPFYLSNNVPNLMMVESFD